MPNIKSQIKRDRQNQKRQLRNISVKSELRTLTNKYLDAAAGDDKEKAKELLNELSKKYDQAAAKGIIHKNQAARKKSQLFKKIT